MGNRFTKPEPLAARFWLKVAKSEEGCWAWTGATDDRGYGQIRESGRGSKLLKAHRVSWTIANGPIPDGLNVLHRCDNPPCCRPDHLFLGTLSDNSQDAARKGRLIYQTNPEKAPRGSRSGSAKLNEDQVAEIRRLHAGGHSQSQLARDYGVTQAAIWYVVRGRTWKP